MTADHIRLATLLRHLHDLELRLPPPHERPAVEVARAALRAEVSRLSQTLHARDYLRSSRRPRSTILAS
ncbi:MAG: hypothetical protein WAT39_08280 [Planctomycetota bacterium]